MGKKQLGTGEPLGSGEQSEGFLKMLSEVNHSGRKVAANLNPWWVEIMNKIKEQQAEDRNLVNSQGVSRASSL